LVVVVLAVLLVVNAPSFLGELAVEMALSMGLIRGLKNGDGGWFMHVFRKTRWPFIFLLTVFSLLGLTAEYIYPEAHTLIDVWDRLISEVKAAHES